MFLLKIARRREYPRPRGLDDCAAEWEGERDGLVGDVDGDVGDRVTPWFPVLEDVALPVSTERTGVARRWLGGIRGPG